MHILVTAGPTREYVDPVRFISNESSGRMGFCLAAEAASRGFRVTLIAGPVQLATPKGVQRVDVVSAREMLAASRRAFRRADALFMAAAVSDWRPRRRLPAKWRKESLRGKVAELALVKNPDILAALGRAKGKRLVVGFALETGSGRSRALEKMRRKSADFIVLNDTSSLNADRASVTIFGADGSERRLRRRPKTEVAHELIELAARWKTR
jgi:phosphopantothenoylcysteine decarboxylase/phosphopantothenate--cysteine ligase